MPPIERDARHQKAVLWTKAGVDGYANPTLNEPEEIEVRWQWTRRNVLDATKKTVVIEAIVVTDRRIEVDSILWLGGLDDIPGTSYVPTSNIMIVKFNDEVPDIRGRETRYTLQLMRYTDTLPEVV